MPKVKYSAGYFYPAQDKQFDIQRDQVLIDKGSHFFCLGHLVAVEIEQMSRKEGYCLDCYSSVREG